MSFIAVKKAWYDSTDEGNDSPRIPSERPTNENTVQTKLYNFDPMMAHPKYGEDLAAMRLTNEEVLGRGLEPSSQPRHNIDWEKGVSELLGSSRYPDEEMHEVTHHGVKYLMRPDGKVQFPIKQGDKGVWLARPTESDAKPGGLFTHRDADRLVFVRGKPKSLRGMGRAYARDSDEARENVAEMFLQRKKPIDPDRLVDVRIPKDKEAWEVLRDLGLTGGIDEHGRSQWDSKIPIKKFIPRLPGLGAAARGAGKVGSVNPRISPSKPFKPPSYQQRITAFTDPMQPQSSAGGNIFDSKTTVKPAEPSGRQTTLGEHHPDFPSPHGDVKFFHGTSGDRVSGIQTEGLKAGSKPLPHQKRHIAPMTGNTGIPGTVSGEVGWVTPHQGLAEGYATQRSRKRYMNEMMQPGGDLASPTQEPTVFGVREAAGKPVTTMGGANYFSGDVQPEHLVRMPWNEGAEYNKLVGTATNPKISEFVNEQPTPEEAAGMGRAEGFKLSEPMDIVFQLLKMSQDEIADMIQDELEGKAPRISEPKGRRKQRSMGLPERVPSPERGAIGVRMREPKQFSLSDYAKQKRQEELAAIRGTDMARLMARFPTVGEEGQSSAKDMLYWEDDLRRAADAGLISEKDIVDLLEPYFLFGEGEKQAPIAPVEDKAYFDRDTGKFDTFPSFPSFSAAGNLERPLKTLRDVEGLTGLDSIRLPVPMKHDYVSGVEGKSTVGRVPHWLRMPVFDEHGRDRYGWQGLENIRGLRGNTNDRGYSVRVPKWYQVAPPIKPGGKSGGRTTLSEVHPGEEDLEEWPNQFTLGGEIDAEQRFRDEMGFGMGGGTSSALDFTEREEGERIDGQGDPDSPLNQMADARGIPNLVEYPKMLASGGKWTNPFSKPTFAGIPFQEGTGFTTGEPMDIAFRLLKDRKSPEAWAHKLEYDKQYQKTPKRVKYREQLNAERRKRGIYGKGGSDVSHTQGGKLTLEKPSSNRARHFKGKGTLRRVKVR